MTSLERCKDRRTRRVVCLLLAAAAAPMLSVRGGETLDERERRLKAMTTDEQQRILRNSERFYKMSAAEQERFRELHKNIANHNKAQELRHILARYTQWLKTLSSADRAKLLGLPADQRIIMIKQLRLRHERERFGFFGETRLPAEDIPKILRWTMQYLQRHEREIIDKMPQQQQELFQQAHPRRRRQMLLGALIRRRPNPKEVSPSSEEVQELVDQLSPEAKAILQKAQGDSKRLLVSRWIYASILAKTNPKVDDDQLERFAKEKLPEAWRERLDLGSAENRKRLLRIWYYYYKRNGELPNPNDPLLRQPRFDARPFPRDRIESDRLRPQE